jgi:hypothetical protein
MDELLQAFPSRQQVSESFKSFLFQPERVSLNSRQAIAIANQIQDNDYDSDFYYQFSCELKSPLLRVKSLELLRATIPNAVPSLPNDQLFFFYYRVPFDPDNPDAPEFADFTSDNILVVQLYPTNFYYSPNSLQNPNEDGRNTSFGDYDELVDALNRATTENSIGLNNTQTRFIPGDITFSYNDVLKRIGMKGNNMFDNNGDFQYFYSPVGYNDPNLASVIAEIKANYAGGLQSIPVQINTDGYTLNRRLGFTFNGILTMPPENDADADIIGKRVIPNILMPFPYVPATTNQTYTAENPADLVNSGNIFLYCDIAGGSTQDTNANERLLAVIPTNASNLGVIFGESKLPCELTKTSENIYTLNFTLLNDTGQPFYLPTNAYVNLELKVTYR